MLTEIDFLDVVRLTPLVAIDLIVRDAEARVLIGHRRNRPASPDSSCRVAGGSR